MTSTPAPPHTSYPAHEVEQSGRDGRMWPQREVHHQYCRLDVHDVVLLRVIEQPVVEQRQLGVGDGHLMGSGRSGQDRSG